MSTGQLSTRAPLDFEAKRVYSVTLKVHDSEDAHGKPDHSSDATLAVLIVITDVNLGTPYDLNHDETIERVEVLFALGDYFKGVITEVEALAVLRLYLIPLVPCSQYAPCPFNIQHKLKK